jgi:16S rRNA (cytosine967-C5)-methyltransferase
VERISAAWPESLDQIISANNEQPPMVLRVNKLKTTREKYLGLLANNNIEAGPGSLVDSSIVLEVPCSVDQLPGFDVGLVSVQDEASQLAAHLLVTGPGDSLLDACAAPGGKTCHLLEVNSSIKLVANDKDRNRLNSVRENLSRLGLSCELTNTDLLEIKDRTFKKILLDAPCSATGIIRRHPDIKLLRRNSDIDKLCAVQLALLNAAWALLEQGGDILYSTCSVLPEENEGVLNKFIHQQQDVEILPIHVERGINLDTGLQLLPTSGAHDGFYFAHLRKIAVKEALVSNLVSNEAPA